MRLPLVLVVSTCRLWLRTPQVDALPSPSTAAIARRLPKTRRRLAGPLELARRRRLMQTKSPFIAVPFLLLLALRRPVPETT